MPNVAIYSYIAEYIYVHVYSEEYKTCMHDSTNTYTAQLVNKYSYVHKIHTDNYNYRHRCILSQVICNR